MANVFLESSNIISSLGWTTEAHIEKILDEISGLSQTNCSRLSDEPLPLSLIDDAILFQKQPSITNAELYTRLEQLIILSIQDTLSRSKVKISDARTLLVLASTKGNINLLDAENAQSFAPESVNLWKTAQAIENYFQLAHKPMIISNACVSGVVAFVVGKRMIDSGQYDNVVVVGADELTKFIVSGFQSFKSLSAEPCKPFDANRNGLSLGEGVASVVLTNSDNSTTGSRIVVVNGATSNDANHISGPSRTGEGLYLAINKTIKDRKDIDVISAHGTATPYNDDMESKAIYRCGLADVPVTGIKGYIGHTLGAAGVIEVLVGVEALKRNMLIKTLGYSDFGVAERITISETTTPKQMKTLLKLASGFGGCNAAALFEKLDA